MKLTFIYPAFERHAASHPELLQWVPCEEYFGSPSLGIAHLSAVTPEDVSVKFIDDRLEHFDPDKEDADLFALSVFTPAATRAMEIGSALLARGKKVVMGGIFPTHMPSEVSSCSTSVVVGEGEPVWHQVLEDAGIGKMKPVYKADGVYDLSQAGPPDVGIYINAERSGYCPDDYPLQLCRGCPMTCSACAIPGVMGRKFRFFPHEVNLQSAMDLFNRGKRLCLTEDTLFLPGNRRYFRKFLSNLHERLGGEPLKISYVGISMPLILNMDDELLHQLIGVGLRRFYLVCGFDPITQKAFGQGDPESLVKCAQAIRRCHEYDITPYISLLVGTEYDDEDVFDRMLEFANTTEIETAEFAIATPYPGTPAWKQMLKEDRILTREWKKYNDANVVFRPKNMSSEQLLEGYLYLWKEFYSTRQGLKGQGEEYSTIQF